MLIGWAFVMEIHKDDSQLLKVGREDSAGFSETLGHFAVYTVANWAGRMMQACAN